MPGVLSGLLGVVDSTGVFHSHSDPRTNHLFTDSSCFQHRNADLSLASWGVINATTGQVVASGHVPGLAQTTPRAEISAVLAAMRWIVWFQVNATICSDALHCVTILKLLLEGQDLPVDVANKDLWLRVSQVLTLRSGLTIYAQHTPSHLVPAKCGSPFEEWLKKWNDHVDRLAVITNQNRPAKKYQDAARQFETMDTALTALQQIYFLALPTPLTQVRDDD